MGAIRLRGFDGESAGNELAAECSGIKESNSVDFVTAAVKIADAAKGLDRPYEGPLMLMLGSIDQHGPILPRGPGSAHKRGFAEFDQVEDEHASARKNGRDVREKASDAGVRVLQVGVIGQNLAKSNGRVTTGDRCIVGGGMNEVCGGSRLAREGQQLSRAVNGSHPKTRCNKGRRQTAGAATQVHYVADSRSRTLEAPDDIRRHTPRKGTERHGVDVSEILLVD